MPDRDRPFGNRSLYFLSSSPRNRSTGVALNPRIRTTFNLNVVADSVWDHNRTQFRLFRGAARVGITVVRSGRFAQRRNIYIIPRNLLIPNTDYRLVILPGLQARNGDRLGETVTIRFRTRRREIPVTPIPQE